MKTTLNAKSARTAVKFVSGIISRRTVLPILANVHCSANGHFEVTGTDLDVTLRAQCPCTSTVDGATTLPAVALVDACAGNADFDFEVIGENGGTPQVAIRAGGNTRNIMGLSAGEFPPMLEIPADARTLTFPAAEFIGALKSVAEAQSTDESRYVLNGVCVDISAQGVHLIATDGRRLHLAQLTQGTGNTAGQQKINAVQLAVDMAAQDLKAAQELYVPVYQPITEGQHKGFFQQVAAQEVTDAAEILERAQGILAKLTAGAQFILPAKAVKHILRLPIDKKAPGEITFKSFVTIIAKPGAAEHETHPQVAIQYGDYLIQTKCIEGNYPCYRQVIPRECKETIIVNVEAFRAAVEVAEKATSDKSNSARLTFSAAGLEVTAKTPDVGEATAHCDTSYTGKEFSIALNPRYLLSACDAFAGLPIMTLELIDELIPLKIVNTAGLLAVIMPMRLS